MNLQRYSRTISSKLKVMIVANAIISSELQPTPKKSSMLLGKGIKRVFLLMKT